MARDIGLLLGTPVGDALTHYRIQNVDTSARLFIRESATSPMPNHRPHVVPPGEWYGPFRLFADAATAARGVWAWSDRDSCACVVTALPV